MDDEFKLIERESDIAQKLFRAVSYILLHLKLNNNDTKWVLTQVCMYYSFLYKAYLDTSNLNISSANKYSTRAHMCKKLVLDFFEKYNRHVYYDARLYIFGGEGSVDVKNGLYYD